MNKSKIYEQRNTTTKTNQTNSGSSEHVLIPASHVRVYMCSRDDHG